MLEETLSGILDMARLTLILGLAIDSVDAPYRQLWSGTKPRVATPYMNVHGH